MANNKSKAQVEAKAEIAEEIAEKPQAPAYVSKYTIKELAEAAETAFGTEKVIVLAGLKAAGEDTYTMEEATRIVKAFKNKEVSK